LNEAVQLGSKKQVKALGGMFLLSSFAAANEAKNRSFCQPLFLSFAYFNGMSRQYG